MTFGKHLVLSFTGFDDNMRSKKAIQDFINDRRRKEIQYLSTSLIMTIIGEGYRRIFSSPNNIPFKYNTPPK